MQSGMERKPIELEWKPINLESENQSGPRLIWKENHVIQSIVLDRITFDLERKPIDLERQSIEFFTQPFENQLNSSPNPSEFLWKAIQFLTFL